jgi:1-acyl-sn-glycerol-3-phosphate acyltransferase
MSERRRPDSVALLGFCFDQLLRGGLRGVWVRGALPNGACVWAANHHSWWDGFVANGVLRQAGQQPALAMDGANLDRFGFLGKLGALPVERPRLALTTLQGGRSLIIFPEAQLRSPGALGPVAPGASWLAHRAGVPLAIAATRVVLRGHQKPEAYVDLTVSPVLEVGAELGARLQQLDCELAESDPLLPLPAFRQVVAGRLSWDERIDRWAAPSVLRRAR